MFSESLSSDDDNDRDEDLQKDKYKDKDTQTQTKINKKWVDIFFSHTIYFIWFKLVFFPLYMKQDTISLDGFE